MSASVSMKGQVLLAMLNFSAQQKHFQNSSVLADILMEVTPESLRLVATDMHVLGILHLTLVNPNLIEIACDEPASLILSVYALQPLLDQTVGATLHLTIDGVHLTATNPYDQSLSVIGRAATEYPNYHRIIPGQHKKALTGFSVDASLLSRFVSFAKALGEEPNYSLTFHEDTSNLSVSLNHIPTFYGMLAPLVDLPYEFPAWLTAPAIEPPQFVHLWTTDGYSGIDDSGNTWTMFTLDENAERRPGPCVLCGQTLVTGWLNLDTGAAVCNRHVTMPSVESVKNQAPARHHRSISLPAVHSLV